MFCFDKRNDVEEDLENYQTAKEKYFNIDEFYADYSVLVCFFYYCSSKIVI